MHFKNPRMVNLESALRAIRRKEQVFIHAAIIKPGKHCMMVTHQDEFDSGVDVKTL